LSLFLSLWFLVWQLIIVNNSQIAISKPDTFIVDESYSSNRIIGKLHLNISIIKCCPSKCFRCSLKFILSCIVIIKNHSGVVCRGYNQAVVVFIIDNDFFAIDDTRMEKPIPFNRRSDGIVYFAFLQIISCIMLYANFSINTYIFAVISNCTRIYRSY